MGEEGDVDDSDDAEIGDLPWVCDAVSGELKHFLADFSGSPATESDFHTDALIFEKCFARDVRFLHHNNYDHVCSGTCVKNQKKKTKEEIMKMLKANRAPPCRFEFYHVILLQLEDKMKELRRRGKEIVDVPQIISSTRYSK